MCVSPSTISTAAVWGPSIYFHLTGSEGNQGITSSVCEEKREICPCLYYCEWAFYLFSPLLLYLSWKMPKDWYRYHYPNKWVRRLHVVTQISVLPTETQPGGGQDGGWGVFFASPTSCGPPVTPRFHPWESGRTSRQAEDGNGAQPSPWGFLASSKSFIQLFLRCNELSAARQLY